MLANQSDELRRAAARLRRCKTESWKVVYGFPEQPATYWQGEADWRAMFVKKSEDEALLADAYLAATAPDDSSRDWRSIAIALYERAVWFFHRKSEEFKSKPELDKITQANGREGWISTLAANWHNDFATELSRIMPPEIDMPAAPDDGEAIDEAFFRECGGALRPYTGLSIPIPAVGTVCMSADHCIWLNLYPLPHIKTKTQLRNLLEALGVGK